MYKEYIHKVLDRAYSRQYYILDSNFEIRF